MTFKVTQICFIKYTQVSNTGPTCPLVISVMGSLKYEQRYEIPNNVINVTTKGSDQPAHTRSLIKATACRLNIL